MLHASEASVMSGAVAQLMVNGLQVMLLAC
jgi:hypothetical protein